ncbi:MAG: hypothetical protein ABW189_02880 [Rickettsiales bacterium]
MRNALFERRLLAEEARSWIGTAFAHQGRLKKTRHDLGGVDCLGLLVGAAKARGLLSSERDSEGRRIPLAAFDSPDYARAPSPGTLESALLRHSERVYMGAGGKYPFQHGDILLFSFGTRPQHVGIVTGGSRQSSAIFTRAYEPSGRVAEARLDERWLRLLAGVYSLPDSAFGAGE